MEPPAPTQCNQQAEQMRHIDLCAQHAESSKLSCPSPLLLWSHTRRGHMAQVKIPGAMFCSAFTSAVGQILTCLATWAAAEVGYATSLVKI